MGKNPSIAFGLLSIALAVAIGIVAARIQAAGYLSKTGPGELRFQQLPGPNLPISSLPPLPKPEVKVLETNKPTAVNPPVPSLATLADATVPPETISNSGNTNSILMEQGYSFSNSSAPSDLQIVSPQMLVDYFRPARGSNGVNVIVPVDFMPATAPSALPPSSATYKNQ